MCNFLVVSLLDVSFNASCYTTTCLGTTTRPVPVYFKIGRCGSGLCGFPAIVRCTGGVGNYRGGVVNRLTLSGLVRSGQRSSSVVSGVGARLERRGNCCIGKGVGGSIRVISSVFRGVGSVSRGRSKRYFSSIVVARPTRPFRSAGGRLLISTTGEDNFAGMDLLSRPVTTSCTFVGGRSVPAGANSIMFSCKKNAVSITCL